MEITWTCVGVSGPQMDDFSSHQDCSEALFTFSFDLDLEFALLHLQRAPLSRGKKERRSSSLLVSYLYFTRNMTGCHLITAFMSFGKTQNYLIWKMGIHFKSENGRFFISVVRYAYLKSDYDLSIVIPSDGKSRFMNFSIFSHVSFVSITGN